MDKTAEILKIAEVEGALAGLIDAGQISFETQEDFDKVAEYVGSQLQEDYDLNDMFEKVAEAFTGAEDVDTVDADEEIHFDKEAMDKIAEDTGFDVEELVKIASENTEAEIDGYMATLTMQKMAGEISEEEYNEDMTKLAGAKGALWQTIKGAPGKAWKNKGKAWDATKKAPGKAWDKTKKAPGKAWNFTKNNKAKVTGGAAALAGAGGAGYYVGKKKKD